MTEHRVTPDYPVVEFRQYTLHPGKRAALIELFEREFLETQEAIGMAVLGQFCDRDDPDRFVWLRGFADMAARRQGLAAFYGGPCWRRHRDAANATMIDSDNVLLLQPAWPGAGIATVGRAAPGATAVPPGILQADICCLDGPPDGELVALCRGRLAPLLARSGASALGWWVTGMRPNDFPQLPVREGEHVLLVLMLFADAAAHDAFTRCRVWDDTALPLLQPRLARPAERLHLAPTPRSALHA